MMVTSVVNGALAHAEHTFLNVLSNLSVFHITRLPGRSPAHFQHSSEPDSGSSLSRNPSGAVTCRRRASVFFRDSFALCLGSILAKLGNLAKTRFSLSAYLMGFGCPPSLGCLNGFAPSSSLFTGGLKIQAARSDKRMRCEK